LLPIQTLAIEIQRAGKQAKILNDKQLSQLLAYTSATRYPIRNRVIVLLSVKAGLRAGEIAKLTWGYGARPERPAVGSD
jgi:integrase